MFEEDFKQERADREKSHIHLTSELTKYQGIAKTLEEKLTHTNFELTQATHQLGALRKQRESELALQQNLEDSLKELEEEKLVLTQQVKAYSRQCEELKKKMVQLQEKSKALELQVYHKEKIASEVYVIIYHVLMFFKYLCVTSKELHIVLSIVSTYKRHIYSKYVYNDHTLHF